MKVEVSRTEHDKCQRCWHHHVSVGQIFLYQDLCCSCAYDIHNELVPNAHLFKKEGDLSLLVSDVEKQ